MRKNTIQISLPSDNLDKFVQFVVFKLHYLLIPWVRLTGTVDGYSSSLRDATGPVDVYSRIPTSTQVTCIAA